MGVATPIHPFFSGILSMMSSYNFFMNENLIDELYLFAWRSFITSHATVIYIIDRELVEAGCIPLNWYDVLIELYEAPDHRLRMHELAQKVVLSRSGLTRLVDKLEKEELLYREIDPSDRRGFHAILTDKGHAALRQAWPVYAQGIVQHFARHLNDQEAQLITEIFNRILEIFSAVKG